MKKVDKIFCINKSLGKWYSLKFVEKEESTAFQFYIVMKKENSKTYVIKRFFQY
jgi:hypothetical protein